MAPLLSAEALGLISLIGVTATVIVWEHFRPRSRPQSGASKKRANNIGFWLLNTAIVGMLFTDPPRLWEMRGWSGVIVGFLVIDLGFYVLHRTYHAVPFLWRWHALHHSDPDVDWSTSVRFHPGESLLTATMYWLGLCVSGAPVLAVVLHRTISASMAVLTHANIHWPAWLERRTRWLVITLDMHLLHHSKTPGQANQNYGDVLSIWDRLFGTLSYDAPNNRDFGVATLDRDGAGNTIEMLLTPLRVDAMNYHHNHELWPGYGIEVSAQASHPLALRKRIRLRARLVRDGLVIAAHRGDYSSDTLGNDIKQFTREFSLIAKVTPGFALFTCDEHGLGPLLQSMAVS